jgi:hypothetical protein
MVNIKEIEKVIDNMTDFILESVDEVSDQEEYMVMIGANNKGIMYYDKKRYELFFDKNSIEKEINNTFSRSIAKHKKIAIKKYFNKTYPNLLVKKISSSKLSVD